MEAPRYTSPVQRRGAIVVGCAVIAIASAVGFFVTKKATFGGALLAATLVTLAVLFTGLAVVLRLFVPTHIEVGETRIRLVAPRTETTYDPTTVVLVRQPTGVFAFIRENTGRVLARFVPPDPDAAVAAFTAAGVRVRGPGIAD